MRAPRGWMRQKHEVLAEKQAKKKKRQNKAIRQPNLPEVPDCKQAIVPTIKIFS
jgi:hypothetical protein